MATSEASGHPGPFSLGFGVARTFMVHLLLSQGYFLCHFHPFLASSEGASRKTAFCLYGPDLLELSSDINGPEVTFPVELSKFRSILPLEIITEREVCALQAHNIIRDMNACLLWQLFDTREIVYDDISSYF